MNKLALNKIKNFVCENFIGSKLFVYGSKIYGEHTQESDLDLLNSKFKLENEEKNH